MAEKAKKELSNFWKILPIVISSISLVLSILSFAHVMWKDRKENIIISSITESSYYFDGERLFVNCNVCISNNSYIPISITQISFERNGIDNTFDSNTLEQLPINLGSNCSISVSIPAMVDNSNPNWDQIQKLMIEEFGSEVIISLDDLHRFVMGCDLIKGKNYLGTYQYDITITTAKGNTISSTYQRKTGGGVAMSF